MTRVALVLAGGLLVGACAPKQVYTPPTASAPAAFSENADWAQAVPGDATLRGRWWETFGDPTLNDLESRVEVSNQSLKAIEAQFTQALAAVRGSRAAFYPQVGTSASISRTQLSTNRAAPGLADSYGDFLLPGFVNWEADVWGRIRNQNTLAQSAAQATAADVETARLSVHAELAVDYFILRGLDNERRLLDAAVEAYQKALDLTRNRYKGGLAAGADVAQAETQLESTRALATETGVQRAVFEHAIAVLIGRPASEFTLPAVAATARPPAVPAGLPAQLLERRPDIAASERRVAAATAQLGVTQSAFYPVLALTASGGFESKSLLSWLSSASTLWSMAPTLAYTAFDGGRRRAVSDQARAAVDQAVANYQQLVLVAFREVEDQLATLRVLNQEAEIQARAVAAAERSLAQANNRYRGGVTSYLEVVTAQNAALTNQRTASNLLTRRLTASVLLIKALGGGWNGTLPEVTNP